MARLPQPGADAGNWGQILNDFLSQSHDTDGSLKQDSVTGKQLAPNAVDESVLGATGGSDGQVLVKDSTVTGGMAWRTSGSATVPDATTTQKGVVQLAGDLAGTALAPTVPGLAAKANIADVYTKTQVDSALANKANTSALSSYILTSQKGTANGVASLDATGKVPAGQLPSSPAQFNPIAGTNVTLSGTYPNITFSAAGGGGGSATNLTNTPSTTAVAVGSSTGTGTTIAAASSSAAGVMTAADKTALDTITASPGNSKYYGTDASGTKGYYALPSGGGGGGPSFTPVQVTTATYTASVNDYIFADASSTGITITLPAPALNAVVRVQAMDNSPNSVQVMAPSGSYINGPTAGSIAANIQYQGGEFWSDGTNWFTML